MKINSKWITQLNVKPKIIKLLKENIKSSKSSKQKTKFFGLSKEFLDLLPKHTLLKEKLVNWN